MKRSWLLGAVILGGVLVTVLSYRLFLTAGSRRPEPERPLIGYRAPGFQLLTADGRRLALADFRGKPVIINFWATWCGPCAGELADFRTLRERTGGRLEILAVAVGETAPAVQAYAIALGGLPYPLLVDTQGTVATLYGLRGLPTSVFVDAEGRIRGVHVGVMPLDRMLAEARKLID